VLGGELYVNPLHQYGEEDLTKKKRKKIKTLTASDGNCHELAVPPPKMGHSILAQL
jgi:hypothetical protein